ncbi:MAG TPA: hypothetical protein VF588_09030 [Pyrinomonadaceae bacterium]
MEVLRDDERAPHPFLLITSASSKPSTATPPLKSGVCGLAQSCPLR